MAALMEGGLDNSRPSDEDHSDVPSSSDTVNISSNDNINKGDTTRSTPYEEDSKTDSDRDQHAGSSSESDLKSIDSSSVSRKISVTGTADSNSPDVIVADDNQNLSDASDSVKHFDIVTNNENALKSDADSKTGVDNESPGSKSSTGIGDNKTKEDTEAVDNTISLTSDNKFQREICESDQAEGIEVNKLAEAKSDTENAAPTEVERGASDVEYLGDLGLGPRVSKGSVKPAEVETPSNVTREDRHQEQHSQGVVGLTKPHEQDSVEDTDQTNATQTCLYQSSKDPASTEKNPDVPNVKPQVEDNTQHDMGLGASNSFNCISNKDKNEVMERKTQLNNRFLTFDAHKHSASGSDKEPKGDKLTAPNSSGTSKNKIPEQCYTRDDENGKNLHQKSGSRKEPNITDDSPTFVYENVKGQAPEAAIAISGGHRTENLTADIKLSGATIQQQPRACTGPLDRHGSQQEWGRKRQYRDSTNNDDRTFQGWPQQSTGHDHHPNSNISGLRDRTRPHTEHKDTDKNNYDRTFQGGPQQSTGHDHHPNSNISGLQDRTRPHTEHKDAVQLDTEQKAQQQNLFAKAEQGSSVYPGAQLNVGQKFTGTELIDLGCCLAQKTENPTTVLVHPLVSTIFKNNLGGFYCARHEAY